MEKNHGPQKRRGAGEGDQERFMSNKTTKNQPRLMRCCAPAAKRVREAPRAHNSESHFEPHLIFPVINWKLYLLYYFSNNIPYSEPHFTAQGSEMGKVWWGKWLK